MTEKLRWLQMNYRIWKVQTAANARWIPEWPPGLLRITRQCDRTDDGKKPSAMLFIMMPIEYAMYFDILT